MIYHIHKIPQYDSTYEMKANVIGKRISELRRSRGYSQPKLAALLGTMGIVLQPAAISKWEIGSSIPSAYQLIALCQIFGIENFSFFVEDYRPMLDEIGERKVAEYRDDLIASGKYSPEKTIESQSKVMPVSTLRASAGFGAFLDEGNFEKISFPSNAVPPKADFAIRITGDSMEPVYSDGQLVWVQQCAELRVGEVGLFVLGDEGFIKMYSECDPEDRENYLDSLGIVHKQPVLISYNENYAPIKVSPDKNFRICGRIVHQPN